MIEVNPDKVPGVFYDQGLNRRKIENPDGYPRPDEDFARVYKVAAELRALPNMVETCVTCRQPRDDVRVIEEAKIDYATAILDAKLAVDGVAPNNVGEFLISQGLSPDDDIGPPTGGVLAGAPEKLF